MFKQQTSKMIKLYTCHKILTLSIKQTPLIFVITLLYKHCLLSQNWLHSK